jgi:hypothetical protein
MEGTTMDDQSLSVASAQELEQQLSGIASQDYRMFAHGKRSRAARLLVEIHNRFDVLPRGQKLMGTSNFSEWVEAFCKSHRVSRSNVFYLVKAGRFLLPLMTEDQFERLEHEQRITLTDLAEAGRLTPELLRLPTKQLKRSAAPLLGKSVPEEECLIIEDHWSAIAALLRLGNLLDFKTYTAHSGTKFQGKKLSEIATLADANFPRLLTKEIERSARLIDVIWFKEDEWPDSFFEVEHSTDIKSGLHRMYQVRNFEAKFLIVAPEPVRERFSRVVGQSPYKQCPGKYVFRSYTQLDNMYRAAVKYRGAHDAFFGR